VRLFRRRRYFYDRFTFDEFSQWSYDMFRIGLSVSAWQGDYGKAECLNCRSVVSIGVPSMTGLEYGKLCEAALDDLVAKWRIIAARRGNAGATGAIAMDFYTTQIRGINNIVDLLAFAIARLAEKD
jgi:hypothetical protein